MRVTVLLRHKTLDGTLHMPNEVYECDPDLAARSEARGLVIPTEPLAVEIDWWTRAGRVLSPFEELTLVPQQLEPSVDSLTILQATTYDPGCSVYRLHSAINECSRHASMFVRFGDDNPYCSLRQVDGAAELPLVRHAVKTADVVHSHMDFAILELAHAQWRGTLVHHYHGSETTSRNPLTLVLNDRDEQLHAIQIGARLYHQQFSERMHWLPIAIPVERYAQLAARTRTERSDRVYRIAHSPTSRRYKGTQVFLDVMEHLRSRGVEVQPVLIENMKHGDALRAKAACDATFDSFWLGLQGSGLEAGAMGQPVIAGDVDAKAAYDRELGFTPYTFADNAKELEEAIMMLVESPLQHAIEAERVGEYVRAYHSYAAVAEKYEEILDSPDKPQPLKRLIKHKPPTPLIVEPEPLVHPTKPKPRRPQRPPLEKR